MRGRRQRCHRQCCDSQRCGPRATLIRWEKSGVPGSKLAEDTDVVLLLGQRTSGGRLRLSSTISTASAASASRTARISADGGNDASGQPSTVDALPSIPERSVQYRSINLMIKPESSVTLHESATRRTVGFFPQKASNGRESRNGDGPTVHTAPASPLTHCSRAKKATVGDPERPLRGWIASIIAARCTICICPPSAHARNRTDRPSTPHFGPGSYMPEAHPPLASYLGAFTGSTTRSPSSPSLSSSRRLRLCDRCQGHRIEKVLYNHMRLDQTCGECDGEGVVVAAAVEVPSSTNAPPPTKTRTIPSTRTA